MKNTDGKLVTFAGGTKDNAITRECAASLIYADKAEAEKAEKLAAELAETFADEISAFEPDFACEVSVEEGQSAAALKDEDAKAFIGAIRLAPNGVYRRNIKMDGFVVVSSNLGVTRADEDELVIVISPRSSVASLQEDTKARLALLAETFDSRSPTADSIRMGLQRRFKDPRSIRGELQRAVRQRTETGSASRRTGVRTVLRGASGTGCDRGGPTLYNVHTPDENVPLDSFERFYELLKDVLGRLAAANRRKNTVNDENKGGIRRMPLFVNEVFYEPVL